MYKQDRATTEKHAKILRELVKRPENKVCADCKRNDPRWASWNIGVFVCIRCSGVHRSMGTHISKVKSVDLDTWSVEQIQSIQQWGNHRANLYWEAHLRQGHAPPEHKIDSFIRSKYELRRWAMEGPPPVDPSTLENGAAARPASGTPTQPQPTDTASTTSPPVSHSSHHGHKQRHILHSTTAGSQGRRGIVTEQPGAKAPPPEVPLNVQAQAAAKPVTTAPQTPATTPAVNDLFSLDFHSPPIQQTQVQSNAVANDPSKRSAKDDIMSLFSTPQPQAQQTNAFATMNNTSSLWGAPQSSVPLAGSIASVAATNAWGAQTQTQVGWTPSTTYPTVQNNVWGSASGVGLGVGQANTSTGNAGIFSSADVWGAPVDSQKNDLFAKTSTTTSTKDDAFGDIWGGFK